MDDYNDILRVQYFPAEKLIDLDFTQDQDFHRVQRSREDWLTRVAGVAQGLSVSASGTTLTVTCGSAFDGDGNLILLTPNGATEPPTLPPLRVDGTAWSASASGDGWELDFAGALSGSSVTLSIWYAVVAIDPGSSSSSSLAGDGLSSSSSSAAPPNLNTRYQMRAYLDLVAGPPPNVTSPPVVLATIEVSSGSFAAPPNYATRGSAGLGFPGPQSQSTGGVLRAVVDAVTGPRLEIAGASGVRLGYTNGGTPDPISGVQPLKSLVQLSQNTATLGENTALSALSLTAPTLSLPGLTVSSGPPAVSVGAPLDVQSGALHVTDDAVTIGAPTMALSNVSIGGMLGQTPGVPLATPLYLAQNQLVFDTATDYVWLNAVQSFGVPVIVAGHTGVSVGGGATPAAASYGLTLQQNAAQMNALSVPAGASLQITAGQLTLNQNLQLEGGRIRSSRFNTQTIPLALVAGTSGSSSSSSGADPWAGYLPLAAASFTSHGGTLVLCISGTFQSTIGLFTSPYTDYAITLKNQYSALGLWVQGSDGVLHKSTGATGGLLLAPCRQIALANGVATVAVTPTYWVTPRLPAGPVTLTATRSSNAWPATPPPTLFQCVVTIMELPF